MEDLIETQTITRPVKTVSNINPIIAKNVLYDAVCHVYKENPHLIKQFIQDACEGILEPISLQEIEEKKANVYFLAFVIELQETEILYDHIGQVTPEELDEICSAFPSFFAKSDERRCCNDEKMQTKQKI